MVARDGPRTTDPRVRQELLDVTARCGIHAGFVMLCATALIGALLWRAAPSQGVAAWAAVTALTAGLRIALCVRWDRVGAAGAIAPRIDPERLLRWERTHAALAIASGTAWASLGFLAGAQLDRSTLLVGFGLTVGLVLGSSFHAAHRAGYFLFVGPLVLAPAVVLQRLAIDERDVLLLAWLGLVAMLYLLPRFPWVSLRQGLATRVESQQRAVEQEALLDTAPLGILVVRDTRIAVCNDALLKMLGYARKDQLVGRSVRVVIPDDEAWQQLASDAAQARRGVVPPCVVRRLRADGTVIDVMRNVAALPVGNGDIDYIGIYEDVHERLAIEERHRYAVQMQRLVFESAGEGIAIVHDGVIEQANQALSDLVGIAATQLAGRALQSIFEDPHGWAEIERRFQRVGNTLKLERRLTRSDGRPLWVNVTGCLVDAPQPSDTAATAGPGSAASPTGKRSIWILADLSVQKQKEAENWHHANHDVMTGLPNRRFLQDRLDQALAPARRDGRGVAVVELDLDGFKAVNDTHGHHFGDAVLEEVARRLSTVVRELDTVGRWGGDEFVLVLKEIESREVVEETVKRVIARLSEPIVHQGRTMSIGASIGIAVFPDHGPDVEALMLAADLAMYESKGAGGNTWRFGSPADAPRGKYRPSPDTMPA